MLFALQIKIYNSSGNSSGMRLVEIEASSTKHYTPLANGKAIKTLCDKLKGSNEVIIAAGFFSGFLPSYPLAQFLAVNLLFSNSFYCITTVK